MTRHGRNNLHHESGGKFAHTIANIGHEIGKTVNKIGHGIGNIIDSIVKKSETVITDLHNDFKTIIGVPKQIIDAAPNILNSAGTAVNTPSQGIGSALQMSTPLLFGINGVVVLVLIKK